MTKISLLSKISLYTLSYSLNLISIPLVTVFFLKFGNNILAGEFSFFTSLIFIICQIFSVNSKNIIISDNDKTYGINIFFFRLSLLTIIVPLIISILFLIESINYELIILYCFLIVFQWVYEIKLIFDEIEDKIRSHIFFVILYIIQLTLIFYSISEDNFILLGYIIYASLLFYFLSILNFFSKNNLKNYFFRHFNLVSILKKKSFKYALTSSALNNMGVLLWRCSLFFLVDPKNIAIYFTCFALASFPGTIINLSIGPTIVKELSKKNLFLLFSLTTVLILYVFFVYNYFSLTLNLSSFEQNFLLKFSLIGTFMMVGSIIIRHYFLRNQSLRNSVYKFDYFYSLFLSFLVPIIYMINPTYIYLSYFYSSILSFLTYFLLILKIKNEQN